MKTIEKRELLTAEETGGRLTRTEIWVPAEHVDPDAETRFEVVRGRMVLERDGRQHVLLAGERARVPPGARYRWSNGGADELHVIMEVEISPPAGA
jgi:mannose-6-phosphate isomerase-like protein (cupin superfamily)